jgi:sec-independent protein translocase protein TatA
MNILTSLSLAAFGLGGTELVIIFLIVLLLFGGAKLPGLAKGLGQSIKEFKKASKDEDEKPAEPKPPVPTAPKANDKN